METKRIEILDPKVLQILNGLTELKLIRISDQPTAKNKDSVEEKVADKLGSTYNGKRIRAILQEMADNGGIKSIKDPVAWQREQRKDRKIR